jgi:hypothetical protein
MTPLNRSMTYVHPAYGVLHDFGNCPALFYVNYFIFFIWRDIANPKLLLQSHDFGLPISYYCFFWALWKEVPLMCSGNPELSSFCMGSDIWKIKPFSCRRQRKWPPYIFYEGCTSLYSCLARVASCLRQREIILMRYRLQFAQNVYYPDGSHQDQFFYFRLCTSIIESMS